MDNTKVIKMSKYDEVNNKIFKQSLVTFFRKYFPINNNNY